MTTLGQSAGVFGLAFVMSISATQSSSAADSDDHSYLPPWMLANAAQPQGAQIHPSAKPAPAPAPWPATAEPAPAPAPAAKETASNNLDPKAAGEKVFGFVSNLIGKSWRFARGE
ncbi:MAG: hypothetical protein WCD20_06180 [Rhodomicrobium sp.]